MKNKTFIIVDLEATCYENTDPKRPKNFVNEIIEIGAVKLDHTGKEIDRFSKFLKPKVHPVISDFCHELTTITQDDIDYADDASIVLDEFADWVGTSQLISWGLYDKNQLEKDFKLNGLSDCLHILEDHESLKHLHGGWNNLRKGGIGMGGALKLEGIKLEGTHHRGIDDAINIAKIFRKYIHKFA